MSILLLTNESSDSLTWNPLVNCWAILSKKKLSLTKSFAELILNNAICIVLLTKREVSIVTLDCLPSLMLIAPAV